MLDHFLSNGVFKEVSCLDTAVSALSRLCTGIIAYAALNATQLRATAAPCTCNTPCRRAAEVGPPPHM